MTFSTEWTIKLIMSLSIIVSIIGLVRVLYLYHRFDHSKVLELRLIAIVCYSDLFLEIVIFLNITIKKDNESLIEALTVLLSGTLFLISTMFPVIIAYVAHQQVFNNLFSIKKQYRCLIVIGFMVPLTVITSVIVMITVIAANEQLAIVLGLSITLLVNFVVPLTEILLSSYFYIKIYIFLRRECGGRKEITALLMFPLIQIFCQFWPLIYNISFLIRTDKAVIKLLSIIIVLVLASMGFLDSIAYGRTIRIMDGSSVEDSKLQTVLMSDTELGQSNNIIVSQFLEPQQTNSPQSQYQAKTLQEVNRLTRDGSVSS